MSSYWGILLIVVLIVIWIVAGGYITQANIKIRKFEGNDPFFKKANDYAFWAAFITWFLVTLFILLIILAIAGVVGLFSTGAGEAEVAAEGAEEDEESNLYKQYSRSRGGISWSTIIALIFTIVLVSITGILAALAAEKLKQSSNFTESNIDMKIAYDDCVIAAIMCLGTAGLLILSVIFYFFIGFFEQGNNSMSSSTIPSTITPNNQIGQNISTNINSSPATITPEYLNEQIKLANEFKKGIKLKK